MRDPNRAPIRFVMVTIFLLMLAGCQTVGSGVRSVSCEVFEPIYWNAADTRATVRQVVAHNAVGKTLCGWKPQSAK